MYPHHNCPDEPDHDHPQGGDDGDGVVIPPPRSAADDDVDNLPETGPDQPVWWYHQTRTRGGDRRFSGRINRVGGVEGEWLRGELAAVIRELLDWAADHSREQSDTESTEDGEAA